MNDVLIGGTDELFHSFARDVDSKVCSQNACQFHPDFQDYPTLARTLLKWLENTNVAETFARQAQKID